jgi:hypothetical protein
VRPRLHSEQTDRYGYGGYGGPQAPSMPPAPFLPGANNQPLPPQLPPISTRRTIRRGGPLGWWLDLTAPPRPLATASVAARERVRKAELTSLSILVVFGFVLALISNSLADPGTAQSVAVVGVTLILVAALNRLGLTRTAAYFLPSILMLVIMSAILMAPGGLRLIVLPAYDLFVIPVILVSLIGYRHASWLFAAFAIAFIVADFLLQPRALITAPGATGFDDIAYETGIFGTWGMINRHVLVVFFAAFIGWLGARSVDGALRRADRAEEIAALEHAIADQKRQLDIGIQQILQTHVRAANGDFTARAPTNQENVLWQIASSLNNLLARLQRAGQAEHQLNRTEDELRRLAAALDDAQSGRPPLWPAPTGTAADLILDRLARAARRAGPSTPRDGGFGSGFGQVGQGGPMGYVGPTPSTPGARGWHAPSSGGGSQTSTPLAPHGALPSGDGWWQGQPSGGMPGGAGEPHEAEPVNPWTTLQEPQSYQPQPYAQQYPPEP